MLKDVYRAWRMRMFMRANYRRNKHALRQLDVLLHLFEQSPQLRKHVRQVLRVRGYEK